MWVSAACIAFITRSDGASGFSLEASLMTSLMPELALELLDRLAGLVGRDAQDVIVGQ